MEQLTMFDESKSELRNFMESDKYRKGVFKTKDELIQELRAQGKEHIYRVLSFGGGTQSSHLLEQHFKGLIHYDYIIFSDTGAEPEFIHQQVEWWKQRQKEYGNTTPFITTHHKSMERGLEEMLMRYIYTDYQRFQLPIYCNEIDKYGNEVKGGLMPRQCTVDFKIIPVKQTARRLVMERKGLKSTQRMPKDTSFIIDIGFSYDEIKRINVCQSPQFKYMYLSYPLVEENLTTNDSIQFLRDNNMPDKRSRCYLCPFNCDKQGISWDEIIEEESLSFIKACWIDEQLRKVQRTGTKMMKSIPYLHYKRIPLKEAYSEKYAKLYPKHQNELAEWIIEWEQRLAEKYGVEFEVETNEIA
ncbi:hypothetical protein ABEX78_19600 [Priestia megaterium]